MIETEEKTLMRYTLIPSPLGDLVAQRDDLGITGLYLPDQGKVTWDGVDIAGVDQRALHSQVAVVLQDPPAGSQKKGAFSVLSLASVRAPKLVASDAPALAVALSSSNAERALVTVSDAKASFGVFLVRTPNLQVDFNSLSSEPLASGTVPGAQKGFVAQEHPEGRITFIDLNDGGEREITGFELSSKVVNE